MDVLRIATAGSVDDGKSSLIGRLLYDTKSIYEDQFASIERASAQRGSDQVELALLTDGLRAEREQNITIDVAHRYFSTPKRKFIIADTPGHVQYTRNMVTGTSNADVSVILVDATKGILPQSKRHAAISCLLRVPRLIVAINKMDLVAFSSERFHALSQELREVIQNLGQAEITFIPISALKGDNVVERSVFTPWYDGPTLLDLLEEIPATEKEFDAPFRMSVQGVIRPGDGYRALSGTVASGHVAVGDTLTVLPSRTTSPIRSIRVAGVPASSAQAGDPVAIELAENVDASRGNLLTSQDGIPNAGRTIEAVVCWLGERALEPGEPFIFLHGTRRLGARVDAIHGVIDVETLQIGPAQLLSKNDLGRVRIRLSEELYALPYSKQRDLGSFVLADRGDFVTVAAGMIESITSLESHEAGRVIEVSGDLEATAAELRLKGTDVLLLSETDLVELNADEPNELERRRRLRAVANLLARDRTVVIRKEEA